MTYGQKLTRELRADARMLTHHITFKGQYLYGVITQQAGEEFNHIYQECRIWQQKAKTDHYLEAHSLGTLAALYGNGTFVHLSVEVSYLYSDVCYDYLPVWAVNNSEDLGTFQMMSSRMLGKRSAGQPEHQSYLTPGSWILTPVAVETPCAPKLPQKWQVVQGDLGHPLGHTGTSTHRPSETE